ncbi:MAG TPA: hypothetical protein VHU92_12450 [Streptosporangiaceae bacterium]|jgi:hypothetical protein|nr:hypothetical protein [Streptosporangiaceae bacterium]
MTGEFVVAVDDDTGQLRITGPSTGPAGGAVLAPAPGLYLLFDRGSGRLGRLTIDLPDPGGGRDDHEPVRQRVLNRLFGAAPGRLVVQRALCAPEIVPEPAVLAAFSRLALFDAARAMSPVPATSPLWTAEAALLAEQAGLAERAQAEAASAAAELAGLLGRMPLPDVLAPVVAEISRLASASQPEATRALRDGVEWFDGSLTAWLAEFGSAVTDPLPARPPGLRSPVRHSALDIAAVPGLLLPGLTPDADMVSHLGGPEVLIVEGRLGPGADREALSRCRVRLVDPEDRRIIAQAPMTPDGLKAHARLPVGGRSELSRAWLEVMADADAPVHGTTVRTVRLALRWADAALRAGRRPRGLAPGLGDDRWARLAGESWEQCRGYWESAGDHEHAGQVEGLGRSRWPGYLAETVGPLLPDDQDHGSPVARRGPGCDAHRPASST